MEKPWVWGLRERGGFKGLFWRYYVLKSKTVAMGGENRDGEGFSRVLVSGFH
jgi:hypothetical protein